jgi:hypothetical protein
MGTQSNVGEEAGGDINGDKLRRRNGKDAKEVDGKGQLE